MNLVMKAGFGLQDGQPCSLATWHVGRWMRKLAGYVLLSDMDG